MKNPIGTALVVLILAAIAGCGAGFSMTVPDTFVELEPELQEVDGYVLRATTTDGAVIGVTALEHKVQGNLGFWSDAISRQLTEGGGYELLDTSDVTAATNQPGRRMDFGRDAGRQTYHFVVVVYVTDDHIWLVEAGGDESTYAAREPQIAEAIASFRIN